MIPQTRYRDTIAPPLGQHDIKQQQDRLTNLLDIERASKMLLGALYRQHEMNPVDYLDKCLTMDIEHLPSQSAEFLAVHKYIKNTCED